MMIYTLGETVFDIILDQRIPVIATPGGAMLNTAISLGRSHTPVSLITDYAADVLGDEIEKFLQSNNVCCQYINRFFNGKTAVALAVLDQSKNAHYSFYEDYPKQRLAGKIPDFSSEDYLLFGSYCSIAPEIRSNLLRYIVAAKSRDTTILYDPNFREEYLLQRDQLLPAVQQNCAYADIIKGSDEDFFLLWKSRSPQEAYAHINSMGNKILLYTANKNHVTVCTKMGYVSVPVPRLTPISTVGAGDTFSAGMMYALCQQKTPISKLSLSQWKHIAESAIRWASVTCCSKENYITQEFAKKLL